MSDAPETRIKRELEEWKRVAKLWMGKLFAYKEAVAVISNRYFDENDVLLDYYHESLKQIEEYAESLVSIFNSEIESEGINKMEFGAIPGCSKRTDKQVAYLIDIARAEASDVLGGERLAMEIAEWNLKSWKYKRLYRRS